MVSQREQLQSQQGARAQLEERNLEIVSLRDEGLLLWEIADRMGVTKERVRQILAKAKAMGMGSDMPKRVVTRRASILLGMSAEMRPNSFRTLMARFGVSPVANKRGRLYWDVDSLRSIQTPKCAVCGSPIPLSRYTRSVTCSRRCSISRRSQQARRASARSQNRRRQPQAARRGGRVSTSE